MKAGIILMTIATALSAMACSNPLDASPGGTVNISVQQSLTGQTTSAGTFVLTGAFYDEGATTEELTFGGALTEPTVPITFKRVLTGRRGTVTITGSAVLAWTSATAGTLTGTWSIQAPNGAYQKGSGSLSGTANFGVTPPTATLKYVGVVNN
ncbi:MAG: hypothetical protein H7Z40_01080 [Phycisphaerae bacterium]|nr:hypothetical protein [Gemmatimonadaceae bacterium]